MSVPLGLKSSPSSVMQRMPTSRANASFLAVLASYSKRSRQSLEIQATGASALGAGSVLNRDRQHHACRELGRHMHQPCR